MNSVIEPVAAEKDSKYHFDWLYKLFLKPRQTLHAVNQQQKNAWLAPLLVLSVLALIQVLVTAPIRRNMIQMGLTTPPDFQYYSAEQQAQFLNAQATQTSPLFLYVFPVLFALVSIWLSWFLLSSILHLILTMSGSHAPSLRSYNLVGWGMLPLGLRSLVQIIAMLATHTPINGQGLSGLLASDVTGFAAYVAAFLGMIDLFFLWMCVLIGIGVRDFSGLNKNKVFFTSAGTLLIYMLLFAVPGFLKAILSNLTIGRYYFF